MKINIRVYEDFHPGTVRADVSNTLLAWYREAVRGFDPFTAIKPVEGGKVPRGAMKEIDVWLVSRETMQDVFGETLEHEGRQALGAFLVHNPEHDPFDDAAPCGRRYRIAIVSDRGEAHDRLAEEIEMDGGLTDRVHDYEAAEIDTLFYHLAQAALFAANSNFNSPQDIDTLHEAGEIGNDLFDMSTGYGIRDLPDEYGAIMEAEDAQEAGHILREWASAQARSWTARLPVGPDGMRGFYAALGVDVPAEPDHEPGA